MTSPNLVTRPVRVLSVGAGNSEYRQAIHWRRLADAAVNFGSDEGVSLRYPSFVYPSSLYIVLEPQPTHRAEARSKAACRRSGGSRRGPR